MNLTEHDAYALRRAVAMLDIPAVTDVIPLNGFDEAELLRLTASAERGSEHPLGQAVVKAAQERGITFPQPQSFEAESGVHSRSGGWPNSPNRPSAFYP